VRLAIIDTETGGLNSEMDELLDAHVLLIEEETWSVIHEAGGRIFPTGKLRITAGAAAVNGYDAALWQATARRLPLVLADVLLAAVQAETWVGSNPQFDVKFLQAAAKRLGLWFAPRQLVDTAEIGKRLFGSKQGNLDALCKRFRVEIPGAHTARADCYRTLAVLPHIWRAR